MARLGIYSTAAPLVGQTIQVAQDAQALSFSIAYTGRPPSYDGTMYVACMEDLKNAANGNVSLNFFQNEGSPRISINSKNFVEVAEIYATTNGGEIVFTCLNTTSFSGTMDWRVDFAIPLSNDGTLPLTNKSKFVLEFEKFSNLAVIGVPGHYANAVIKVDTHVTGYYAGTIQVLDTLSVTAGSNTNIEFHGAPALIIPADLVKLNMISDNGMQFELKDDILDSYIKQNLQTHILADGLCEWYYKYFALPIQLWRNGNVTLSTSKELYLIRNIPVM